MLSRRAALMVGAGLVAAPMLVKTAAAEGQLDTTAAVPAPMLRTEVQ